MVKSDKMLQRLGLFGGAFDPIHAGHLSIAQLAQEQFNLDQVHFITAQDPPQKTTILDASARYSLVKSAVASLNKGSEEIFIASSCELDRPGPSYSYQTIAEYKQKYPQAELFWILGYDAYLNINTWKNLDYIIANTVLLVCPRAADLSSGNYGVSLDLGKKAKVLWLKLDKTISISSSKIRERLVRQKNSECLQNDDLDSMLPSVIRNQLVKYYSQTI
jgi:nicotinate-nucleotide adenylyltransferase